MVENDIYNSKARYESFVKNYENLKIKPKLANPNQLGKRKYYCKNSENLQYFKKLFKHFDSKDISYVRRIRLLNTLKMVSYATEKNFKDCEREDIDSIVAFMHTVYESPKSKRDFITDIKHIRKILLPEKDEKGRIDENLVPYAVRHLNAKQDKSREKRREDKLTIEEFEKLIKTFSQDVRLQAYITLAWESLGRPQEILYTKIKDVDIKDDYAQIWISEHGKEGTGFLECIDSFPYVVKWFNQHPLRNNPDAYFFINLGDFGKYKQLKPFNINKHLREKLKLIGINKKVTCYSLKRSGVSFRRIRGDSDVSIQHAARWTSSKQLKTYDLSEHDETFKIELAKRGLIKDKKYKQYQVTTKKCIFCEHINGIADDICANCKRPLNREKIVQEQQSREKELQNLKQELGVIQERQEADLVVKEFIQKLSKSKEGIAVASKIAKENPKLFESMLKVFEK